jgi:hypothetical protein
MYPFLATYSHSFSDGNLLPGEVEKDEESETEGKGKEGPRRQCNLTIVRAVISGVVIRDVDHRIIPEEGEGAVKEMNDRLDWQSRTYLVQRDFPRRPLSHRANEVHL